MAEPQKVYPTAEQLRRLAYVIRCEDDYLKDDLFVVRFGEAVLSLWGSDGYAHAHKPSDQQLSVLNQLEDSNAQV